MILISYILFIGTNTIQKKNKCRYNNLLFFNLKQFKRGTAHNLNKNKHEKYKTNYKRVYKPNQ